MTISGKCLCGAVKITAAAPPITADSGTLDAPTLAAPLATIWSKSAPSCACIHESLPKFAGQGPPVA